MYYPFVVVVVCFSPVAFSNGFYLFCDYAQYLVTFPFPFSSTAAKDYRPPLSHLNRPLSTTTPSALLIRSMSSLRSCHESYLIICSKFFYIHPRHLDDDDECLDRGLMLPPLTSEPWPESTYFLLGRVSDSETLTTRCSAPHSLLPLLLLLIRLCAGQDRRIVRPGPR